MLFVMGLSATVNPLTTGSQVLIDAFVMLTVTVLVFIFSLKGKLGKAHGITLLCIYVAYLAYLILRTVLGGVFNLCGGVLFLQAFFLAQVWLWTLAPFL